MVDTAHCVQGKMHVSHDEPSTVRTKLKNYYEVSFQIAAE